MREQYKGTRMILVIFFILVICAIIGVCIFPVRAANEINVDSETYQQLEASIGETYSLDHEQVRPNYRDLGRTNSVEPLMVGNSNFSMLNAIFLIGAVILAFLSTDKVKAPVLTYSSIIGGFILFIFTTGLQKVVIVNVYTIIYACILAICIFEYVMVNKVKE